MVPSEVRNPGRDDRESGFRREEEVATIGLDRGVSLFFTQPLVLLGHQLGLDHVEIQSLDLAPGRTCNQGHCGVDYDRIHRPFLLR